MLRLDHVCTRTVLCLTAATGTFGTVAAKPTATEFEEAAIVVERTPSTDARRVVSVS